MKESRKGVRAVLATTKVQKWGNSLAVRIPTTVAERVAIHQGTDIELAINENQEIVLTPILVTPKTYTLDELLAGITPENRHEEIDFGKEGNEII